MVVVGDIQIKEVYNGMPLEHIIGVVGDIQIKEVYNQYLNDKAEGRVVGDIQIKEEKFFKKYLKVKKNSIL